MVTERIKSIISRLRRTDLTQYSNLELLFQSGMKAYTEDGDLQYALKISGECKNRAASLIRKDTRFYHLYNQCLLFEAPHLFDSFLLYMEKNRPVERQFYLPRRKVLKVIVDDLQDLEDGKLDFLGISLPPRTGKSTLCQFFMAWIMGKRPNSNNAMGGHSGILADGFYTEMLNLTAPPEKSEYTFYEIFPGAKRESQSADLHTINLDKPDKFSTFTARGIEGTWTGAINISNDGYLYVDDLVRDRTESLSPTRLNNRYQDYLNVMVDRKNDGSRELMVGTRWNIMDTLGRVEKDKRDNPRYRFRKIPALDENNQSNFQYDYGVGFSTKYYLDIKDRLDPNEWMAKYQQRPFIREGLLFPEDELRFFNGILPPSGFVRVVSVADIAWGGGDALSQPIGFEYENGDVYIPDWVFNRGAKEVTIPIVAGKIMGNKIQQTNFEANNGGEMYAKYIDDFLTANNYKCSITYTKAPGEMAKMAKIIQYSGDIKRRFIFLAPNAVIRKAAENDEPGTMRYYRTKEYDEAMDELETFVQIGNNEHDDSPDSLSQLERFIEGGFMIKTTISDRATRGI